MTAPLDLFDPPFHHDGLPTEKSAAKSARRSAASLRELAYAFIRRRGREGATRDEVDAVLGKTPNVTQPRLWELEHAGRIQKTGRSRETRSGRQAVVYIATGY